MCLAFSSPVCFRLAIQFAFVSHISLPFCFRLTRFASVLLSSHTFCFLSTRSAFDLPSSLLSSHTFRFCFACLARFAYFCFRLTRFASVLPSALLSSHTFCFRLAISFAFISHVSLPFLQVNDADAAQETPFSQAVTQLPPASSAEAHAWDMGQFKITYSQI
jgi:hypothetical protein